MAKNTSLSGRIPVAIKITAVVSATMARLFGSVIIRMYISTNKMIPIELPSDNQVVEFKRFLEAYRNYDPSQPLHINENKCKHCVYCNICDKMDGENVYQ